MLTVAGIGPGKLSLLTLEASHAIQHAQVLVGGHRQLEMFPSFTGRTRVLDADIPGLMAWLETQHDSDVVVLASGDPLIYGIGSSLVRHFGVGTVRIIPGISSIQYFCTAIGIDMNDLFITSSHGRTPDFKRLFSHNKVAMVTDELCGPRQIADALVEKKLKRTFFIGENLARVNERIHRIQPDEVAQNYGMNVVVLLNER